MARLLILTPQLPFPPHQGTTIRNYNLIVRLAQRHQVDLLSLTEAADPPPAQTPLLRLCRRVNTVPAPRPRALWRRFLQSISTTLPDMALRLAAVDDYQAALADLVRTNPYDVVQVEGIEMAPYALWLQRQPMWQAGRAAGYLQLVFDDHNAEFLLQQRTAVADAAHPARWPAALYSLLQWQKLTRYEALVCRQADAVVAVSAADAAALRRLTPDLAVTVVPNGVDLEAYHPDVVAPLPDIGPQALVFSGKMDYRPNVDAVLWFANEILPLIQRLEPGAHLLVVGQKPHPRLQALQGRQGIHLTGRVADVRPYLAAAALCVLPFRMGSGTRLKILEAMAMGKPVVSTRLGAEGYGLRDGQELRLADSAANFAACVVELLRDSGQAARLASTAQAYVSRHYGWDRLVPDLEAIYHPAEAPLALANR